MTALTPSRLIGYLVEPVSLNLLEFTGTAEINGEPTKHLLATCAQPRHPIDVGRNKHGDLVWVSPHISGSQGISEVNDVPLLAKTSAPLRSEPTEELELPALQRNTLRSLVETLSQRRVIVISSAVSGVLLVVVGLGITSTPPNSTAAVTEMSSASNSSEQPETGLVTEPTQAAIEFVLEGKVPGVSIPGGVTSDSLTATVVSTSGEIVLVDVQANEPEGLTTFATLLLQKSGTAWRIREVFDPR